MMRIIIYMSVPVSLPITINCKHNFIDPALKSKLTNLQSILREYVPLDSCGIIMAYAMDYIPRNMSFYTNTDAIIIDEKDILVTELGKTEIDKEFIIKTLDERNKLYIGVPYKLESKLDNKTEYFDIDFDYDHTNKAGIQKFNVYRKFHELCKIDVRHGRDDVKEFQTYNMIKVISIDEDGKLFINAAQKISMYMYKKTLDFGVMPILTKSSEIDISGTKVSKLLSNELFTPAEIKTNIGRGFDLNCILKSNGIYLYYKKAEFRLRYMTNFNKYGKKTALFNIENNMETYPLNVLYKCNRISFYKLTLIKKPDHPVETTEIIDKMLEFGTGVIYHIKFQ